MEIIRDPGTESEGGCGRHSRWPSLTSKRWGRSMCSAPQIHLGLHPNHQPCGPLL